MCDLLIPGLILGGLALAAASTMGGGAAECAPACPPPAAYAPPPPQHVPFREKTSYDQAPAPQYVPAASYGYATAPAAGARSYATTTRTYGSATGSKYTYPVYGANQ